MNIAIIAAMSTDGTIGDRGKIPWHISEDLKRFKRLTMGHPVIMGRKTYESIGKPLPGRTNIVLSRTGTSLASALEQCRQRNEDMVFIIGGAEVYRQALPMADTLLITEVHRQVAGDTKFPDYDRNEWAEAAREDGPEYSFVEYVRKSSVEKT